MARIAVGGFQHETNCFVPKRTDFAYFAAHRDRPPLVRGQEVFDWLADTSIGLSGFMADMADQHTLVPLLWTSGGAGGYVTRDAFERIAGELIGGLSREMPVDAIYLDLHGAMVTEDFEDAEGELLRRVRAAVGRELPLVISLDYHANVTPAMVEYCDGMAAYLTYPHIDRPETGQRAAKLLSTILERGRPCGRALRKNAIPYFVELPVHHDRTVQEYRREHDARRGGRRAQPILSRRLSPLRSVLLWPGGDRVWIHPGGSRRRGGYPSARDRPPRGGIRATAAVPRRGRATGDEDRRTSLASGDPSRHPGQPRMWRQLGHHRPLGGAGAKRRSRHGPRHHVRSGCRGRRPPGGRRARRSRSISAASPAPRGSSHSPIPFGWRAWPKAGSEPRGPVSAAGTPTWVRWPS